MIKKRMTLIIAALATTVCLGPAYAQGTSTVMVEPSSEQYSIDEMFDEASSGNDMMAFAGAAAASSMSAPGDDPQIVVVAEGGGQEGGWQRREGEHHILTGSLAVTDDQFEKLHSLHEQYMDQIGSKVFQKHTLKRHMHEEMMAPSIDASKVKDMADQLNKINGDLEKMKVDHMLSVAQVFTPEQRKALRLAMIKHQAMHEFMHHGGGHHHGFFMHRHHGGGMEGEHHGGPGCEKGGEGEHKGG